MQISSILPLSLSNKVKRRMVSIKQKYVRKQCSPAVDLANATALILIGKCQDFFRIWNNYCIMKPRNFLSWGDSLVYIWWWAVKVIWHLSHQGLDPHSTLSSKFFFSSNFGWSNAKTCELFTLHYFCSFHGVVASGSILFVKSYIFTGSKR